MEPSTLTLAGSLAASLPLASLVHELGHATGAWLGGQRVAVLVLGSGRWTWWWRRQRPRLGLRPLLVGGLSVAEPAGPVLGRRAQLLELLGGALANLVLAALLWLPGNPPTFVLAAGQLLLALAQLLPLPGHDGAALLQLLWGRPADPAGLIRDARELRGWGEEALAQRLLASAASLEAEAGGIDRAAELLGEHGAPVHAGAGLLYAGARALLAARRADPVAVQTALDTARQQAAGDQDAEAWLAELVAAVDALSAGRS